MGGCAELVMTGKVVTLGGVSAEGGKRGQITAPIALRSGLIGEWSAAGASGGERCERGYGCRWGDRAVCAVNGEAGVELGGTPETRIRTAAMFNSLNVRRLLKGRVT